MLENNRTAAGHLSAAFTVLLWGTTFISTKVLLAFFSPLEILFFRFIIGYVVLLIVSPKRLKLPLRQEFLFALTGFCGVTLYFLMENVALTMTMASNVGVIITVAPFLTALLAMLLLKTGKPRPQFYVGFAVALVGVALISFNGQTFHLNPLGDLLALLAALTWAFYNILIRRVGSLGYGNLLCTRRVFFWGLITMLPAFLFMDFSPAPESFTNPVSLFNLFFLGIGASAICYLTWNFSTRVLGPVKTSVYLYAQPAVTVAVSAAVLHEPVTALALLGTALTLSGLIISELKRRAAPPLGPPAGLPEVATPETQAENPGQPPESPTHADPANMH